MIRIYPSMLPGDPLETHNTTQTLGEWLADNVPGYDPNGDGQPIVVKQGGHAVDPALWQSLAPSTDNPVDIYIAPQSGAVDAIGGAISSVFSAVVDVFQSIFSFLMPDIPDMPENQGQQGSRIKSPSAQANQSRINQIIPDVAGQHKIFPDYLNQPRLYFIDKRTLAVDSMMCIGRGEYLVPDAQLKIEETPFSALSQSLDYAVFPPGADVTSHPAHRIWYNAPEVGASLGGRSGLRLQSPQDVTLILSASSVDATDDSGDLNINNGLVPSDWSVGTRLEVRLPRTIQANPPADPSVDRRAVLTGAFDDLGLADGDAIVIHGDEALQGEYIIESVSASDITLNYSDLTPVESPISGAYYVTIDRVGAQYEITFVNAARDSMSVSKLLADGNPDSGWLGFIGGRYGSFLIRLGGTDAEGEWAGPFLACPEGETTDTIEWDVFAPQGLGIVEDDGNISGRSRIIEIQWRESGSSDPWQSFSETVSGSTRDQIGWTFTLNLPGLITPEVRLRRTSVEETGVKDLDRIEWFGLKSKMPYAPSSYDGVTTLALTLEGGDTISGQSENKVNAVVTRKINGSATRSIADYLNYVLDDAGFNSTEIDNNEVARLGGIWDSRGDTFDFIHDNNETVHDTINRILRAGFSKYTLRDDKITPVRDEPRSTFEHMYTPQNMTEEGLKRVVTPIRDDDVDGVDVEYFDSQTWTNETVKCRLPGDAGIRAERINVEGVTDRTRAWRIGMRLRSTMRYRRKGYTFSTEMDALNSSYWSYVALADDVPGYTQTGLILDVEGTSTVTITTSEPLDWQAGETHVIAWRRPDGTLAGRYTATQGADDYTVTFIGEAPVVDYAQELPHYMFGVSQRFAYPAIIQSISPQGFESVNVEAVNYDLRVYDYDNQEPPA